MEVLTKTYSNRLYNVWSKLKRQGMSAGWSEYGRKTYTISWLRYCTYVSSRPGVVSWYSVLTMAEVMVMRLWYVADYKCVPCSVGVRSAVRGVVAPYAYWTMCVHMLCNFVQSPWNLHAYRTVIIAYAHSDDHFVGFKARAVAAWVNCRPMPQKCNDKTRNVETRVWNDAVGGFSTRTDPQHVRFLDQM